jgi:hypothetical protein
MAAGDDPWVDEDALQVVRPYALTGGRTTPAYELNLVSMVRATGNVPQERLDPELGQALELCSHMPVSVAEVAGKLQQPVQVTKVLLSDLIDAGAVTTRPPVMTADPFDPYLLEKLLNGLQQRL